MSCSVAGSVGRRRTVLPAAVLAGLALLSSCHQWLGRALTPAEHQRVRHWLECEECVAGALDSVVAIGSPAVPALGDALLHGPGQPRVDSLADFLQHSYQSLAVHVQQHPGLNLSESQLEYVGRFTTTYTSTYRIRSARALALIGGSGTRHLLDQALNLPLTPYVRAHIRLLRDSVWHP